MWPFKPGPSAHKNRQPPRVVPAIPFVGPERWSPTVDSSLAPYISPQAAEALAAVASCVSLISETIGALPAVVVLADDSRAVQPDHALSRLAVQGCNDNETWSDLISSLLASTLLRGNGLAEIVTDNSGRLAGLRTVPWQLTVPWQSADGTLRFDYIPMLPPATGKKRTLLRDEVVLLKERSDFGVLGLSPLTRSATAVEHALRTQANSFGWMANMSRPSGTLSAPGKVTKETADRLAQDWDSNYSGERFGKTAVLPEGLEFKPLGWVTAEDAQLIERLNYSVHDVCRIYRVPPFFMAEIEKGSTFASAAAAMQFFSANTLRPWVVRLERAFQASVLSTRYRLHVDLTALLKADPDAFAGALLKMRQAGVLTANEARAMLGLPPHADGDSITPPSVMSGGSASSEPAPPPKSKTNGHAHA
jgi:HK97 family phage portal protein